MTGIVILSHSVVLKYLMLKFELMNITHYIYIYACICTQVYVHRYTY